MADPLPCKMLTHWVGEQHAEGHSSTQTTAWLEPAIFFHSHRPKSLQPASSISVWKAHSGPTRGVTDTGLFIALDSAEGRKKTVEEASWHLGCPHKRKMSKIVRCWKQGNVQSDAKTKVDTMARAQGEPAAFLPADHEGSVASFKRKYGMNLPNSL